MTSRAGLVLVAIALVACAEPEDDDKGGSGRKKTEPKIIAVTGEVKLHPLESKWRAAEDLPLPSLGELTVNVEDALRATAGHPALKTTTSDADGKFETPDVDVTNVNLALVASVEDPDGVIADCGYGLVRGRPDGDLLDMPVYVITNEFLAHLVEPTGRTGKELLELGFILVQITDETHEKPIAGAELALMAQSRPRIIENKDTNPLWYLDETLENAENIGPTSESGVILYVPEFGAKEYTAVKEGSTFEIKLAGARKNFVLSAFITEE